MKKKNEFSDNSITFSYIFIYIYLYPFKIVKYKKDRIYTYKIPHGLKPLLKLDFYRLNSSSGWNCDHTNQKKDP